MKKEIDFLILDKVIEKIKLNETISEEDLMYFPEKYSFAQGQFNELFSALDQCNDKSDEEITSIFPETRKYFEYKNVKFIWDLMIGQGASCSLHPAPIKNNLTIPKGSNIYFCMSFNEEKKMML